MIVENQTYFRPTGNSAHACMHTEYAYLTTKTKPIIDLPVGSVTQHRHACQICLFYHKNKLIPFCYLNDLRSAAPQAALYEFSYPCTNNTRYSPTQFEAVAPGRWRRCYSLRWPLCVCYSGVWNKPLCVQKPASCHIGGGRSFQLYCVCPFSYFGSFRGGFKDRWLKAMGERARFPEIQIESSVSSGGGWDGTEIPRGEPAKYSTTEGWDDNHPCGSFNREHRSEQCLVVERTNHGHRRAD